MNHGLILEPVFLDHVNPPGHPERVDRIRALLSSFEKWPHTNGLLRYPAPAVDESWLARIHTESHLQRVRETSGKDHHQLDPDTHTSSDSYQVALRAAGAAVDLTRRVIEGEIGAGFALIRPPGHHAESRRAMGFCLFNNVAAAAEFALSRPGIERVAIIDFDVHHGNGTQEIFYSRSDVLYISSHQYPFYPGTGSWTEMGQGEGEGHTVNFPVIAGAGNGLFVPLYNEFVLPILSAFKPDLLLVSAGYDAHRDDPLAGMMMDDEGFEAIVMLLNQAAGKLCGGRVVYVLEGGYDLDSLCRCVKGTVEATLRGGEVPAIAPSVEYASYSRIARRFFHDVWPLD